MAPYDWANGGSVEVFFDMVSVVLLIGSSYYSREWVWNLRTKLCCLASEKWNVSRVSLWGFDISFHVRFTPNHLLQSKLEKREDLFKVIIFPQVSAKKKELGYPQDQRSLVIMDTFKGQDHKEMKRLCAKNNCELGIVPHNLTDKFWPLDISINQSAKNLSQTGSTHGMLIELANNYQTELHLAMLKYPLNWVNSNLFMLGRLLRHTIISNTKLIPLSKVSMLQGSATLLHVQTMSSHK